VILSDASAPPAPQERAESRALDRALRAAGIVISLLATILTAALELSLTPLRLGGAPVGVSIVLAAVANPAIAWFAVTTTERRWALGPPWALWTLLLLAAAGVRTNEGDYLIGAEDWVALVMILVGSLAFALYAYRMILHRGAAS
jgi:uncharacterized integral membrane protein